jgi:transcription-repair coupling factor (superfamily II helicase)
MIPEAYVRDLGIRLGLYKRIGDIKDKESLDDIKEELIDRFGPLPKEVENLLTTVEIKALCVRSGIDRIDAGAKGLLIGFKNNVFANPEKLMDLIVSSFGTIKVRPDQRLFIEKDLSSYDVRIDTIKKYVKIIMAIV